MDVDLGLSEVNHLGLWKVFRVERENVVRLILGLEIGNVDGSPVCSLAHLHL
jgi:hypothetical protein